VLRSGNALLSSRRAELLSTVFILRSSPCRTSGARKIDKLVVAARFVCHQIGRAAVTYLKKLALGATAAATALAFTAMAASAQLAPPAPRAQPATPAAPAAKAAPPPAATSGPAAATRAAPKKTDKAATSACQGLDEKSCSAKSADCRWIAAIKRKDGKEQSAHCRSVPKSVKAAPRKTEAAAKSPAAPPAAAAPKAPAAPAKAPPAATK
jgi:pyruvate dehydrogenase E2 component (dihydrolipoamide acetyltransferase)